MEPKNGRLVKALYDFPTDDDTELSLLVGDIIQVKERIDKQWSRGVSNDREGNFPIGFTVEIKIPSLGEQQSLFAVANDFIAQEDGDLNLKKGDLVIGYNPIDSNWWKGENSGQCGIFPLTHVWKINKSALPESNSYKKMCLKAKVKMNMKAQLPEEMDLFKDDIVNIVEEVDKGWYRGECNGRQGIFPASFVTLLQDNAVENCQSLAGNHLLDSEHFKLEQNENHSGYDCLNSGITPYGRTIYPFQAEFANELSFGTGEIVNLIRHVDSNWTEGEINGKSGIFPSNFVNIVVDCPNAKGACDESKDLTDVDLNVFPADTYGRVICDFYPQLEGDVRLREGDTVTLIRKIDHDWYEVVTDSGDTGICPESYIEVIGSGPPSYNEVMGSIFDKHNNAFIDSESSVGGKEKFTNLKFENSTSFPLVTLESCNSSQERAINENLYVGVSSGNIDDKIFNSLKEFETSALNSSKDSFSSYGSKSSSFSSSSLNDSGIASNKMTTDLNDLLAPSLANETYQNIQENNCSYWSVESSSNEVPKDDSMSKTQNQFLDILSEKAPSRPPPPANVSRNASLLNSSSSSLNSTRLSATSLSSQSSSEMIPDSWDSRDIRNQIQQKEQMLKQRIACKTKLENESSPNSSFVSNELKSEVAELTEDIEQLERDIEILKSDPKLQVSEINVDNRCVDGRHTREEDVARKKDIEQERREKEKIKKMKELRECTITEILQTERDYISDLKLLQETFLRNPMEAKAKGLDIVTLFGNLDEVIDVASRLLRRLQKVSGNSQMIGEIFVDMSDEMKEVYGHYCRNHDEVNSVIDKVDGQSDAGQYLKHKLEILKRQTNCFDLTSMLIKPVQRILKYPLLLNGLLKCTEDGHPDKPWLVQAISLMTDVATAINEFKRRKDLVFKYRKQADTSLSGRISKFSIHSMVKKSARFGMRLSSSIGLKTFTKDEDFEKVVQRFTVLEKCLKIFQKDICYYSKKTEELVTTALNLAEDIAEFYQERKTQQEVEQFRSTHKIIVTQLWESFKKTIERSVNSPIKLLLQAFRGPTNLIQKRNDKLLDYESSSNKAEKNKDATKIKILQEAQNMDKHNYEALNSQLLDDLPKLCDLSIEILCDCIRCFLKAKKNFIGKTAMHMFNLMDLPLLLGGQGTSVLETFQVKHTLVVDDLCQLSIVTKQLQSCIKTDTLKRNSSPRGSRLSFSTTPTLKSQSPSQKARVKSSYPHSDLYTACQNFDAVDIMDISLKKGDIVGVIKQQDPMGSRLRWFVDSGEAKGFVPAKNLMKFLPDGSSQPFHGSVNEWTSQGAVSGSKSCAEPQAAYAKVQKVTPQSQNQRKTNDTIHPARPVPPLTTSLRIVAPSRYPSIAQGTPDKSKELNSPKVQKDNALNFHINTNSEVEVTDPLHRYEEIDEGHSTFEHNKTICDINLMGDASVTAPQTSVNVLDEFDPYSTPKPVPELYDNVHENLNCLYSSHRYEDIPDDRDTNYDEVPNDLQHTDTTEYYYAMYDFSPTGSNQLSLRKGQVVLVLHKCDLNSNSEWWFVEDRHGSKGYVPSAYLNKYSKGV